MQSAISSMAATALALPPGNGAAGTASLAGNPAAATTGAGSTPFADLFADSIGQVNQLETQAHNAVSGLMTGSGVDVHQAMIATQKASMAFELALAVRNKAVQAYQQVMSLQF
jgi:flagellar hook-basal body complex protein FliE